MGVVCAIRKKKVSYFFWPNDILYYFSYFFRCGKEKYKNTKKMQQKIECFLIEEALFVVL
jgi:hypothetical protein